MGRTIVTEKDVRGSLDRFNKESVGRKESEESVERQETALRLMFSEEQLVRLRELAGRSQYQELQQKLLEELRRQEEESTRAALSQRVDDYTNRLLKYIPAESVALYLTLQGIVLSSVEGQALNTWLWVAFVIGVCSTPLYLWRVMRVKKRVQLAVSTAAFGVWVFALGGAFASLSWYEPFLGSVMLVIFTFFVPLISPDVL